MPTIFQQHCDRWANGCGSSMCARASHVVFARGSLPCDVLIVGQAPGRSEDAVGSPMCGPAGFIIDRVILEAIPNRLSWCIYNLVGCLPMDKTGVEMEPTHEQILACRPRLIEFLAIASPKLVIAAGTYARDYLKSGFKSVVVPKGIEVAEVLHPAAVVKGPLAARETSVRRMVVVIRGAVYRVFGEEVFKENNP